MKEVEEFEGKDGVRSNQRGRKPFLSEQLSTAVGGVFWSTPAVLGNNLVNAADVEKGELITSRGVWAGFAGRMSQLRHKAKGAEEFGGKILAIPSLQRVGE